MPNPAKGPRLAKRTDRGRVTWQIRDGEIRISTGCGVEDRAGAERALQAYIERKWTAPSGPASTDELTVADALAIYGAARREVAAPKTIGFCIKALLPFWGDKPVSAVKGETCRRYVKERRVAAGTSRRELGVLGAALRYCEAEGYLVHAPRVTLPPVSPPRERWLTRSEAARLLRAARPWPHIARFILLGLYTGSRSGVIRRLQWLPNTEGGHVDLERGVLYRQSATERRTKKRAPAARIPRKLLNHLRRWRRMGDTRQWIVEWDGAPLSKSPQKSWRRARAAANETEAHRAELAGREPRPLGRDVVPHALRHTAITWMLQRGAKPSDVSALAGVTLAELERTYMHHSPDHQKSALDALGG